MQQLRVTSGIGLSLLLPLTQRASEQLSWEERAQALADKELAQVVAAQPPTDGEYVRYHPLRALRYEAQLLNPAVATAAPAADLTRIGVTAAELQAESPAVARSLWILSYYADADGQKLLSRNYLRLVGPNALEAPATAAGTWVSALRVAYQQPAQEHAVLYAPAGMTACWLELRLAVARGGRQRVFTTNATGAVAGLLPLTLNPVTAQYAPAGSGAQSFGFTELRPVVSRNNLAPTLNDNDVPAVARYQTAAGGGYLPLNPDLDYAATVPLP